MPTENGEELVAVGRVGKPHGIDGAFVVEQASDDERWFRVGAALLVDGEPARIVVARRVGKGRLAVKLDRPAERGTELAVRRSDLPVPNPGSYYVADLVGLEVVEAGGRTLGRVEGVYPGPANDALELAGGRMLPLIEDCVLEVDLSAGRVLVARGFADDR